MTKNLTREQLDQYAEMLGFKFEDGRSVTTAQLHSVLRHVFSAFAGGAVWEGIESRRITEADQPEGSKRHAIALAACEVDYPAEWAGNACQSNIGHVIVLEHVPFGHRVQLESHGVK